ncbi:hypothetical protein VC83_09321 [Pseudogymnoascus destructans]|uniref:NmrA-like domain-containing protein n=2 Tax=Pseudogymnoascus destructans TaxID=655981 RepID=A0A176ZZU2_9PEZI|nr:uncharacterized protein VC83_09321 [Pseudogymnoascus destructans]OAF54353.1 hypothetical protein VC83_09321 [Pseudogymnoascus destructans]
MPSATPRPSDLPLRPRPSPPAAASKASPASLPVHPPHTPMTRTIAVVNSSGRQAASLIRVASAVGYRVHAQLRNLEGIVAQEIAALPNVSIFVGELAPRVDKGRVNTALIRELFQGAQVAFINTTFWGDEVAIGIALADAAKEAHIQHYIYSSMPDHSQCSPSWPSLPLWASKARVESYIRSLALPATFVDTGIYNNNFTSLPYPLFCMALQPNGSFTWRAPFHPDAPLPWLDAEHDVGPAVLQLLKNGPPAPGSPPNRIALAYERLSPREACRAFSRALRRPVRYERGPIEIAVSIPSGYARQLRALEQLFSMGGPDAEAQPPYFGDLAQEESVPAAAMGLWEGYRGLEEYAREVFPLEEAANGLTWMHEPVERVERGVEGEDESDDEEEGLMMGKRRQEEWLA